MRQLLNACFLFALLLTAFAGAVGAQGLELGATGIGPMELQQMRVQDNQHVLVSTHKPVDQATTVRSVIHFADAEQLENATTIWLAGFVQSPDSVAPRLAIAWVKDTAGWWPKWTLQLLSETPEGKRAPGVSISETAPLPGRRYEAILSYDPFKGRVAVRLTDLEVGTVICANSFQVAVGNAPLYPVAGLFKNGGAEAPAGSPSGPAQHSTIEAFEIYPFYAPIGLGLELLGRFSDADDYMAVWMLEKPGDVLLHLEHSDPGAKGKFQVWVENSLGRKSVDVIDATKESVRLPLSAALFTLGQSTVEVEYVEDGKVLFTNATQLKVGSVTAYVTPVDVNRGSGQVMGAARISSKGEAPNLLINAQARIYRLTWDAGTKTYKDELYTTANAYTGKVDVAPGQEVSVPLQVAAPQEPGIWRIDYSLSVEPSLSLITEGAQRMFSTYTPAKIAPGQSFTIAVLPDTQYYVRNYPDILTRQTEWLAANAQSRNIGLMLHVGDITDNNSTPHWERARDRVGLLNGVVPYVLAVGNHDIEGGSREGRAGSQIDRYFPAQSFPALKGTYEANSVSNSFHTFEMGDTKYLVLSFEFGPKDGALAWANEIVAAHPDHKVIVVTHTYTSYSGPRVTPGTSGGSPELVYPPEVTDSNNGEDIWQKLVRKHPNMLMVVSGHIGVATIPYSVGFGDHGNKVFEFLTDYQAQPNGGNGWLALFEFRPDDTINVQAYSPYLDEYKTDMDRFRNGNRMNIEIKTGRVKVY